MLAASLTGSTGLTSLSKLYGIALPAAGFILEHIESLKGLDNPLANRCGLVLEAATVGFGVGSELGLVVIGLGQAILGNPLTGAAAGAAVTTISPVVLTCASIGAIHYGWSAMPERDRDELAQLVGKAFNIGAEFIRSLARFALDTIKSIMSRQNIEDMKKFVTEAAASFGNRFSDITHKVVDRIAEGATTAKVFVVRAVKVPRLRGT